MKQRSITLALVGIGVSALLLITFGVLLLRSPNGGSTVGAITVPTAQRATAAVSLAEPPPSCGYCTRRLIGVPMEEIEKFAVSYMVDSGQAVSDTLEVLLARPVTWQQLGELGFGCGREGDAMEEAPWALFIFKGDLRPSFPGMERGGRREIKYAAYIFDLWAAVPTYVAASETGIGFGTVLNDPALVGPSETPSACPTELPRIKTRHYGDTVPGIPFPTPSPFPTGGQPTAPPPVGTTEPAVIPQPIETGMPTFGTELQIRPGVTIKLIYAIHAAITGVHTNNCGPEMTWAFGIENSLSTDFVADVDKATLTMTDNTGKRYPLSPACGGQPWSGSFAVPVLLPPAYIHKGYVAFEAKDIPVAATYFDLQITVSDKPLTFRWTLPVATPIPVLEPSSTPPSPVLMQPARRLTPSKVSTMWIGQSGKLPQTSTIITSAYVNSVAWAPNSDKLLYTTLSDPSEEGHKLYWSALDGSNSTLLHEYTITEPQLGSQMPRGNTLLVQHLGKWVGNSREPSHLDVIRFPLGQAPVLIEGPPLAHLPQRLHWWDADRASGTVFTEGYGFELLVTVDAKGRMVEEKNIPYMQSGVVKPGGEWLAYSTDGQDMGTPPDGSGLGTIYLLNLITGERLQITDSGKGSHVGSWSPDGNWLLIHTEGGATLVSADGSEWITIPVIGSDAAWSYDSKRLAYTNIDCYSPDGHIIKGCTSELYIAEVLERKVIKIGETCAISEALAFRPRRQPQWSPDSSSLALLLPNPRCSDKLSESAHIIYKLDMR